MATKSIAWNTGSGNITLTYQGQGDGTISVQSDDNNLGSARSQVVSIQTTNGAVTKNLTVNQAACPFPVNTVKSYSYTGSYQEVVLPAGQYKLQVWGAQGGSNGTNSTYGITAKAGGKGGYSEGIITLSTKTTVRVYVGGQGSSSSGGYNGGGSTSGTSQYNASNELGYSKMGGGGGATDIRLSDGALLSRMIVAGGGAGGAMCYQKKTTTSTSWENFGTFYAKSSWINGLGGRTYWFQVDFSLVPGDTYRLTAINCPNIYNFNYTGTNGDHDISQSGGVATFTASDNFASGSSLVIRDNDPTERTGVGLKVEHKITSSSTTTSNESQVGGVGGGTRGGGYSTTYVGKQNAAGSGGSFGQGANMTTTNYRYCSGAGGGGWYGGGTTYSDNGTTSCKYGGGGSGFVNTAASAGNRPSGYTGLQLDSGTTYAGNTSFPNTAGTGNETGHSGNGYAKITRLS